MMTKEKIDKIHGIFMHMQLVGQIPVQRYDPLQEYRQGILIAKGLTYSGNAAEVYAHTGKLTPWLKRLWEKRKKEMPYTAFLEHYPEANVWRFGFRV